jgi:hypothetical protein
MHLPFSLIVQACLEPGFQDVCANYLGAGRYPVGAVVHAGDDSRSKLIVSFLMLGIAAVLSMFKPWSRTPWSKPNER